MMGFDTVYAAEGLPAVVSSSIFLAGPTPRDRDTPSWRPAALAILQGLGYRGTVMLPEDRSGEWKHSYDDQVEWEAAMRAAADVIVFWVPRDMSAGPGGSARMPSLTTNVEFGLDLPTGKVLYGRPPAAGKNKYLDHVWRSSSGTEPHATLEGLLGEAAALLGPGVPRTGDDRMVPLSVWLHPAFPPGRLPSAPPGTVSWARATSFPSRPGPRAPLPGCWEPMWMSGSRARAAGRPTRSWSADPTRRPSPPSMTARAA